MWWLLWLIPAAILIFLAVIILRAITFKPKAEPSLLTNEEAFDKKRAAENLQELIRCKTVSYKDSALEDDAEFQKLINKLPELYPNVFKVCEFTKFPDRGLLFR